MRVGPWLAWSLLLVALGGASADEGHLVGSWLHKDEYQQTFFHFHEDGSYRSEFWVAGVVAETHGTFKWRDGFLILTARGGVVDRYSCQWDGEYVTIAGGPYHPPALFRRWVETVASANPDIGTLFVGKWLMEDEFQTMTLVFRPDGRFLRRTRVAGTVTNTVGKYEARGHQLFLRPIGAVDEVWTTVHHNDELNLHNGMVSFSLRQIPGSDHAARNDANPTTAEHLVGQWLWDNDHVRVAYWLGADGKYRADYKGIALPIREEGTWRLDQKELTLEPRFEPKQQWSILREGKERIFYSSTGEPRVLKHVDNEESPQGATEAEEKALDKTWRERLPVSAMGRQPAHVAVGEVPADPALAKVFPKARVFTRPVVYLRWGRTSYWVRSRAEAGPLRSSMQWHFLPTGRVFVRVSHCQGTETIPHHRDFWGAFYLGQVDTQSFWGRYHIEEDERVVIELDTGEKRTLQLEKGRRSLVSDKAAYLNVDWQTELSRQLR